YDTARTLGVSKSRTEELIKIARQYTDRILKDQASKAGSSVRKDHRKRKSTAGVVRKSGRRDAGTKISTSSKAAKAKR
ncbi:MAG: hypothetical protein WA718_22215, partial [Terriglobales bacterium]